VVPHRRISAKRHALNKGWNRQKGRFARRLLEASQLAHLSLVPRHFYSQVPDVRKLKASEYWRRPYSLIAIRGVSIESQLSFAEQCCPREFVEGLSDRDLYSEAAAQNGAIGFGPIEAEFLYCFARARKPGRVVQVGAGASTAILLAASADGAFPIDIVCVEPYPTGFLREAARQGDITLIEENAEVVPLEDLTTIPAGGLLFVDSTHAVRPGGEVNRLILEVLPRLARGCFAHFHDIVFPYDYAPSILDEDVFFWSESVLLQAFLTGNPRFEVCVAMSMLHHNAPDALQGILPSYRPSETARGLFVRRPRDAEHFPSSLYLKVSGDEGEAQV
jgi:hypothetical protein